MTKPRPPVIVREGPEVLLAGSRISSCDTVEVEPITDGELHFALRQASIIASQSATEVAIGFPRSRVCPREPPAS
jgi:hypothetical protein